eukprot:scaffold69084_cov22-Phaeocystis_antarctica.AAC.1
MSEAGCGDIVFSSSATAPGPNPSPNPHPTNQVYGDPASVPVDESFPTGPTNPYGWSKLMNEQILRDVQIARPETNHP